jgi:primosomal replication protein N
VNLLQLSAVVVERKAKRYTPAGLPVVEMLVQHQSAVQEAGLSRTIELFMSVKAIGTIAEQLELVPLGTALRCEGFLAPARQQSKRLNLHLTKFELE